MPWDTVDLYFSSIPNDIINPFLFLLSVERLPGMYSNTKLMQFLVGLIKAFDGIRNQILVMDPLPSINEEAFFMVFEVQPQYTKPVEVNCTCSLPLSTMWRKWEREL